MDPETLVTFLFRAPPEARTVELLGSWDNFSHPYRMHPDRRRGHGCWSGCFKFLDIVFDGNESKLSKPRTGGLKQGGTYWYYYRLDDDVETFDVARETTTACPLLPGQSMNVLEVPIEVVDLPVRSRAASIDVPNLASLPSTHTLEPGDKFAALAPPPLSKVHARCVSEIALTTSLDDDTVDSSHSSEDSRPRERNPALSFDLPFVIDPISHRRYASSDTIDDRSSIYTRQSWSSAACSSVGSFVLDVYEAEPSPFADDEDDEYFPAMEIPAMPGGAPPLPARAPPPIPQTSALTLEEPVEDVAESLDHKSISSSPPMPSRLPPAIPDMEAASVKPVVAEAAIEEATSHINPLLEPASRPPTTSRPELRIDTDRLYTPSKLRLNFTSPLNNFSYPGRNRRFSNSSRTTSSGHPTSSEDDEDDDMLSPTFSAATVSSHGGLNTPFRISIGQLCAATGLSNAEADDATDKVSMEKVTEQLRSLGSHTPDDFVLSTNSPSPLDLPFSPVMETDESLRSALSSKGDNKTFGADRILLMPRTCTPRPVSTLDTLLLAELGHLGASIA